MRGFFLIFPLITCLIGCGLQAQRQVPTDESKAWQAEEEQKKEHTQELTPETRTRIEAGICKHLSISASTMLSEWHITGEFEIEAVTKAADERDSQQIIRKRWRLRMGQEGLTMSPLP